MFPVLTLPYSITPEGEAEFRRLLALNLSTYTPSKFPQDLGLAFADALPPSQVTQLLERRREMLQSELDTARLAPPHPGTLQFLVEHSIVHLTSELEWLDKVIAHFAKHTSEDNGKLDNISSARG